MNSFIKDDLDFLRFLPKTTADNSKLVTFDVVSLYTNIPHDLGLEAIKYWINKERNAIDPRFTDDFVLGALKLVLERNSFELDNTIYQQLKGTAMGTKAAPTYATLVLGYLENILYERINVKYGVNFSDYLKNNFKCFLDDGFIIWTYRDIDIDDFLSELNSLNASIQFTMDCSESEIPFLDVLVKLKNNAVHTDVFYKVTNSQNYLDFHSCHPRHTKINIPFNLASRIVTIVSDENLRQHRLDELFIFLRKQHYPETIIRYGIKKAIDKGPITTTENHISSTKVLPYVSTHNPSNIDIFPLLKTCESYLKNDEQMKKVLKHYTVVNSKRQPKNFKRLLTSSRFISNENCPSVSKCNTPRCGTCKLLVPQQSYTFKTGFKFTVKNSMNCKSRNVIYCIICDNCQELYIGQTGDELRNRMTVHRQQIRSAELRFLPVSRHLHDCAGGSFKVFPLYQMFGNDIIAREQKEKLFINLIKPKLNAVTHV